MEIKERSFSRDRKMWELENGPVILSDAFSDPVLCYNIYSYRSLLKKNENKKRKSAGEQKI